MTGKILEIAAPHKLNRNRRPEKRRSASDGVESVRISHVGRRDCGQFLEAPAICLEHVTYAEI